MGRKENLEASSAWFEALNRGDLDALLALASPAVRLEPLRGVADDVYIGREGIQRFFNAVAERLGRAPSHVTVTRVEGLDERRTVTYGHARESAVDFATLFEFDADGLIVKAHTFLGTDEELLRRTGRI